MELSTKLYILDDEGSKFMGAGVLWLLEGINESGSLLAASERMGLSYSKARGMLEHLERSTGHSMIERRKGGSDRKGAVLTPYAEELALENDKIINADFMVTVEKPLLIGPDKKEIILDRRINSFMTYNPYEEEDIINWELLVGQGYPITTGVYGKIYDQDKTTKIKLLKNLKNKILQEVQEEYVTLEDKYLYVIYSTPKIKKLNKMI